jgi:hypothetical protein
MTHAAVVNTRCDDDSAYEDGSDVTIRFVSSSSDRSPFAEFRGRGWPARLADLTSSADVRDVRTPERLNTRSTAPTIAAAGAPARAGS